MFKRNIDPGLVDLINPKEWQRIQDSLSEVLEVALNTFSPDGSVITKPSRSLRLYNEIFPKMSKRFNFCIKFLFDSNVGEIKNVREQTSFKCPFGTEIIIIPIKAVGDRIAAYVVLGPIIVKGRKDISEYAKEAGMFGIKSEELQDALIEINVFSFSKIARIVNLIKDIFSNMAQTGYHKKRLGEIRPEVVELDPLFSRYYEERVLNSLLNSCTAALNADSGSVMKLDRSTNTLNIKVSSKLNEDVVKFTGIKLGEGIAGVAAAHGEAIILPKDQNKNGLSAKMKRGYIKSSIIVPFNKGDSPEVYGVINLNIVRKDKEFVDKDIVFVKEMVNMASIALTPLSPNGTPKK